MNGLTQSDEVHDSGANWIMTPNIRAGVGDMHKVDSALIGQQTRYRILTYISSIGDVINDPDDIIIENPNNLCQLPHRRREAIRGIF
ncbi:hypothetical protein D3C76_1394230 [compost metagenome]